MSSVLSDLSEREDGGGELKTPLHGGPTEKDNYPSARERCLT